MRGKCWPIAVYILQADRFVPVARGDSPFSDGTLGARAHAAGAAAGKRKAIYTGEKARASPVVHRLIQVFYSHPACSSRERLIQNVLALEVLGTWRYPFASHVVTLGRDDAVLKLGNALLRLHHITHTTRPWPLRYLRPPHARSQERGSTQGSHEAKA